MNANSKQITYNLLFNAVKFTPDGSTISIVVSSSEIYENETAKSRIKVSVRDRGIGFKSEDMKRIFNSFEQVKTQPAENIREPD